MLESILAGVAHLAIAFLNNYLARKDLKDSVRKDIEIGVLKLALVASQWKADAIGRPDGGSGLQSGGGTITLPGGPAGP